jgi:hypothetical protein
MSDSTAAPGRTVTLVGAVLVGGSTVLPWASSPLESVNAFRNELPWAATGFDENSGFDDTFIAHGPIFLGLAAVALFLLLVGRHRPNKLAISGVGAAAVGLAAVNYDSFTSIFDLFGGGSDAPSVGYGLYVAAAGGALVVVGPWLRWSTAPAGAAATRGRPSGARPSPTPGTGPGAVPPPPPAQPPPAQHPNPTPPPAPQPSPAPAPQQPPAAPPAPGSAGQWWND